MNRILGGILAVTLVCVPPYVCFGIAVSEWMDGEIAAGFISFLIAFLPIVNVIFLALQLGS